MCSSGVQVVSHDLSHSIFVFVLIILDTIKDFVCKLGIKTNMHLMEIIVRPPKIITKDIPKITKFWFLSNFSVLNFFLWIIFKSEIGIDAIKKMAEHQYTCENDAKENMHAQSKT